MATLLSLLSFETQEHARHTTFEHYLFVRHEAEPDGDQLLALGIGSLFNHSPSPNVHYHVHDAEEPMIEFVAARAVPAGEELCIFYGREEDLWFDVK